MIAPTARSARESRLDPFHFRSETAARFLLLVVAVCGVSLALFALLYNADPGRARAIQDVTDRCTVEALRAYPNDPDRGALHVRNCLAPISAQRARWQLVGLAALVATAGALYWLMPGWIRRWRRLQPLAVDDGPALVRYLAGLCREAGLRRLPTFLIDPHQRSIDGAAFGHIGQYAVVLSAGLVATFSTDRPTFRAVALHELAHLKNRDVDLASLARATWLAFILVAVAPFAFYPLLLAGGPFPATTALPDVAWRLAAATLLVYLLHNAVLRARELYADARVAGSAEAGAALRPVLATFQPPRLDRFWTRWWDALGHRPDSAARRRVLDNPGSLLDAGIGEAFAAGLVAGLALTTVEASLSSLLPGDLGEQGVVAALIVAPLAAGVILPNIWRAAYARVRQGHHPRGIGRAGAALGLGYVLGLHAAPGGQAIVLPQPGGLSLPEALLCDLASTAMLAASLALLFRALAGTATAWLRASRSNSVSGRTMVVALVVGSGLLTVWLHWFTVSVYAVRWVLPAARLFPDNVLAELAANASVALLDPLTLGMLGALLAFRLAASVSRLVRS